MLYPRRNQYHTAYHCADSLGKKIHRQTWCAAVYVWVGVIPYVQGTITKRPWQNEPGHVASAMQTPTFQRQHHVIRDETDEQ